MQLSLFWAFGRLGREPFSSTKSEGNTAKMGKNLNEKVRQNRSKIAKNLDEKVRQNRAKNAKKWAKKVDFLNAHQ